MNIDIKDLIKVSSIDEQKELLEYIGEDYKKVPYLYLDLEKYGVGNENVSTWYCNDNGNIIAVFLLYYDCLHIYSRYIHNGLMKTITNVIDMINPHTIITIDKVGILLKETLCVKYKTLCSYVLDETDVPTNGIGYKVELANREDLQQIVSLFLKTEHYKRLYSRDVLLKQFEQRYDDKFGRFFKVSDGDQIIGSLSTYGENEKFAIVSGMIVDPSFKKPGVAVSLGRWVNKVLREENKINLGFVSEENIKSMKLTLMQGGKKVSDYYQFIHI